MWDEQSQSAARLAVSALCIVVLGSPGLAQTSSDELLDQFEAIQSITVQAGVEVIIYPGDPNGPQFCEGIALNQTIEGSLEYYASGSSWRLNSYLDPTRYEGMQTDVAFDGAQFQYLSRHQGILDISTPGAVPQIVGMTLVNPLFETVQFLSPVTDANALSPRLLTDVRQAAGATTLANVQWTAAQVDGRTLDRAVLPGGTLEGDSYVHHVYVRPGQRGRPLRIDRVRTDGKVLSRTTFDSYDRFTVGAGVMYWPRNCRLAELDPETGEVTAEVSIFIRDLAINDASRIPTGIFHIEWSDANIVILNGSVVQH